MYLDSHDYQTIWKLAHNWNGVDPETTDENNLPLDLKATIQRIMGAVDQRRLTLRNRRFKVFMDESLFIYLIDFFHHRKFNKCLRSDIFIKSYLDSLYVRRAEVLNWCQKDFLTPPPIWQLEKPVINSEDKYDSSDDENEGWYNDLSDRRKQRVVCLDMAKKLWLINSEQSYEEIYNHPTMKQFGNPNVFSLEAFKKWSRPFASEYAKTGGRPIKNK